MFSVETIWTVNKINIEDLIYTRHCNSKLCEKEKGSSSLDYVAYIISDHM